MCSLGGNLGFGSLLVSGCWETLKGVQRWWRHTCHDLEGAERKRERERDEEEWRRQRWRWLRIDFEGFRRLVHLLSNVATTNRSITLFDYSVSNLYRSFYPFIIFLFRQKMNEHFYSILIFIQFNSNIYICN